MEILEIMDWTSHVSIVMVNQHMENSICFLQIIFESFPYK